MSYRKREFQLGSPFVLGVRSKQGSSISAPSWLRKCKATVDYVRYDVPSHTMERTLSLRALVYAIRSLSSFNVAETDTLLASSAATISLLLVLLFTSGYFSSSLPLRHFVVCGLVKPNP